MAGGVCLHQGGLAVSFLGDGLRHFGGTLFNLERSVQRAILGRVILQRGALMPTCSQLMLACIQVAQRALYTALSQKTSYRLEHRDVATACPQQSSGVVCSRSLPWTRDDERP